MDDPETYRMIQTRDGVARVPRQQEGVPIREFFANTDLPQDLDRAVVYQAAAGPVLAAPDPVEWSEHYDQQAQAYADRLKTQIDEKGYYKRSLESFANRLATETKYPREEMQAMIVSKFDATYQQDSFDYLQTVRAEQGLPVREQTPDMNQEHEVDMS